MRVDDRRRLTLVPNLTGTGARRLMGRLDGVAEAATVPARLRELPREARVARVLSLSSQYEHHHDLGLGGPGRLAPYEPRPPTARVMSCQGDPPRGPSGLPRSSAVMAGLHTCLTFSYELAVERTFVAENPGHSLACRDPQRAVRAFEQRRGK